MNVTSGNGLLNDCYNLNDCGRIYKKTLMKTNPSIISLLLFLTLSMKTQLKSFFVIYCFVQKNHPSYGKEHSVKIFISLYYILC